MLPEKRKLSQTRSPRTIPKKKTSSNRQSTRNLDYFFRKDQIGKEKADVEISDNVTSERSADSHQSSDVDDRTRQEMEDALLAQKLQEEEDSLAGRISVNDSMSKKVIDNDDTKITSASEKDIIAKSAFSSRCMNLSANGKSQSLIHVNYPDVKLDLESSEFDPEIIPRQAFHAFIIDENKTPPPIPYSFLVHAFILIAGESSRLKTINILTNTLRCLIYHDPNSLLAAVWLSTNSIAPPYESIELGVGWAVVSKAIKALSGQSDAALKLLHDKHGDLGDVAYEAKVSLRTLCDVNPPSIQKVYDTLLKIANLKGPGTIAAKSGLVKQLMLACKGEEVRYLTRTLVSHLRIGAVKTTMLVALGRAFTFQHPIKDRKVTEVPEFTLYPSDSKDIIVQKLKAAEGVLKECYAQRPDYGSIVPVLIQYGIGRLFDICHLTVGYPLKPMLGTITRDLVDMYKKLDGRPFQSELKYDGQRIQLHHDENGKVSIFSRHLENMTEMYPDIVQLATQIRSNEPDDLFYVSSFIIEGEIVAIDGETGTLKSFQTLTNRGRKKVTLNSITIPVAIFAFDLMYLNGKALLKNSFRQRRDLLYKYFKVIPNRFHFAEQIESSDHDEVYAFFKKAIASQCEGIMVKVLDHPISNLGPSNRRQENSLSTSSSRMNALLATYEPDKRLESWLKVKKDYVLGESEISDSLDLVPIGAWHGIGRKASWWSPFLLASYNDQEGTWDAVCKCMSGFSDAFYKDMNIRYGSDSERVTFTKPSYYNTNGFHPDIWFNPTDVWEIRGADLTLSPVYQCAIGLISEERGISIRFPRFIRTRSDKDPESATTNEQISELYRKQMDRGTLQVSKDNLVSESRVDEDGFIDGTDE